MSGQATVTIKGKTWTVGLALTTAELTQGLGGLASIPADTGLLFDMGSERIITVTTAPMLFPLDIVFLDASLLVTDMAPSQAPGFVLASDIPAKYFVEVNAGEMAAAGVAVGDQAVVAVTQQPVAGQSGLDIGALITTLIEASILAWGMTGMVTDLFPTREEVFKVLPTSKELKEYGRAVIPTRRELRNLLPDTRPEAMVYFVYVGTKVGATTDREEAIRYAKAHGGQVYGVPESIWREGGAFGVDAPTVRIIGDLIFDSGKEGKPRHLDHGSPEAKRLMAPGQFTIRDRALDKLKPYDVVEVHDDGDVTVSHKGDTYLVTTAGGVFKQAEYYPQTMSAGELEEARVAILQAVADNADVTKAMHKAERDLGIFAMKSGGGRKALLSLEKDGLITITFHGPAHPVDVGLTPRGASYLAGRDASIMPATMPRNGEDGRTSGRHKRMLAGGRGVDSVEYLADSPEWLALTIDEIGYRDKLDCAFQDGIRRAGCAS